MSGEEGRFLQALTRRPSDPYLAIRKQPIHFFKPQSGWFREEEIEEYADEGIGDRPGNVVVAADPGNAHRGHHHNCKVEEILHCDAQRVGLASNFEWRNFGAIDPLRRENVSADCAERKRDLAAQREQAKIRSTIGDYGQPDAFQR